MQFVKKNGAVERVYQTVAVLNCLAVLIVLLIYAYGGLFSRYLADDYCQAVKLATAGNLPAAIVVGYNTWLNSYTILVFVQLVEWGGIWGFRLMSGVTILLWTANLTWLFVEIGRALKNRLGFVANLWLAGSVVFLSLYQAPSLYQILYWRTSLIPYTLPLVFFVGTAAYLLRYASQPYQKSRAVWTALVSIIIIFFASGLGETTSAMQVGLLFTAVVVVGWTRSVHRRDDVLFILLASLATAVISLLIIAFSPGTINRLDRIMEQTPLYNPVTLSTQTLTYLFQFLRDHLRSVPLPAMIMVILPFAVMLERGLRNESDGALVSSSHIRLALLIAPLLLVMVIGFSFAPSVFVRSFPVGRVRFASIFVLSIFLAIEGGLLGILASRIRTLAGNLYIRTAVIILLGILIVYPLRIAPRIYAATWEYRAFAAAWDDRDASIRQAVAGGATDLVVVQLDSIGGVGEYKGNERGWINRCAAQFYGLNTLRAP